MTKLFVSGASLALLALTQFAPASAATVNLTNGSFSISYDKYSAANGGPSISGILSGTLGSVPVGGSLPGKTFNGFTLAPQGTCFGGGCSNHIETDNITFTISGLKLGAYVIPTIVESGVFTAKYTGSELSCATGDGKSPSSGETDCFLWNGAASTYNGSYMTSAAIGNGQTLDVTFNNATDWNITPTVSFDVRTAVPEFLDLGDDAPRLCGPWLCRLSRVADEPSGRVALHLF